VAAGCWDQQLRQLKFITTMNNWRQAFPRGNTGWLPSLAENSPLHDTVIQMIGRLWGAGGAISCFPAPKAHLPPGLPLCLCLHGVSLLPGGCNTHPSGSPWGFCSPHTAVSEEAHRSHSEDADPRAVMANAMSCPGGSSPNLEPFHSCSGSALRWLFFFSSSLMLLITVCCFYPLTKVLSLTDAFLLNRLCIKKEFLPIMLSIATASACHE